MVSAPRCPSSSRQSGRKASRSCIVEAPKATTWRSGSHRDRQSGICQPPWFWYQDLTTVSNETSADSSPAFPAPRFSASHPTAGCGSSCRAQDSASYARKHSPHRQFCSSEIATAAAESTEDWQLRTGSRSIIPPRTTPCLQPGMVEQQAGSSRLPIGETYCVFR